MIKRIFPYVLGVILGFAGCAALLFVTAQPRGEAIVLLPAPTPAPLLVEVSGAVVSPGVYLLAPGSRVQDALELAGGLSSMSDPAALNLVARLKDGQKLVVPAVQSAQAASADGQPAPTALPVTYPIDLNIASLEELDSLPGIGPTRAQQILDYRDAHGGFHSIDELLEVPGIGQTTFGELKKLILVEGLP